MPSSQNRKEIRSRRNISQHNVSYIKQKSQKMFDNKRIPTYVMPKQG